MDPSSVRVPDGIEPISAYRAWFYSIEGRKAQLRPLSAPNISSRGNGWDGAGANWVTASCALVGSSTHEVPSEDCSCGFYSLKELDHAVDLASPFRFMSIPGRKVDQVVLGRILLSGKVIEHDFGYRAERARIAELIPFRGSERSVMVLADRLGVGMGSAVEPNSRREALLVTLARPDGRPPARATAPPDPMESAGCRCPRDRLAGRRLRHRGRGRFSSDPVDRRVDRSARALRRLDGEGLPWIA